MRELVRNFAGPGATNIAAAAAAIITIVFSRAQHDIAFQQKEIAKEKLRFDLFDRRHRVFANLFQYHNAILGWGGTEEEKAVDRQLFLSTKEVAFCSAAKFRPS